MVHRYVPRELRALLLAGISSGIVACGSSSSTGQPLTTGGAANSAGGSVTSGAGDSSGVSGKNGSSGSPGAGGSSPGASGAQGTAGSSGASVQAPGVSVTPANARVSYKGNVQFTGLVTGASAQVVWSVEEGAAGGTISNTGLYTAPAASGSFHVTATAGALKGSAVVDVAAPSGTPPTLTPGVWASITKADIKVVCCPGGANANSYGIVQFDIDPGDPRTIYTAVDQLGLWKTTDGGSTWVRLGKPNDPITDTATHYLDSPVAIKVDPKDSKHLYVSQGVRGATMGFWVSHDGGETWTKPAGFQSIVKTTTQDVTTMVVDPSDFKHVLLGSHSAWAGKMNAGVLETKDGGDSWIAHEPMASWPGGTMGIAFLFSPQLGVGDSQTWLVGADGDGFWRTTDSGTTWTQVTKSSQIPHGGSQTYYSPTGYVYAGASPYPIRSKDNGVTWESLDKLPSYYYYSVYGDGTHLYAQRSYTGTSMTDPIGYSIATEANGLDWAPMSGDQKFVDGPYMMEYDAANKIMYSANWAEGLLALKVQ